jgi:hypothetical protein
MSRQISDGVVRVCPLKDIECGDRHHNWCAPCPKREGLQTPAPHTQDWFKQQVQATAERVDREWSPSMKANAVHASATLPTVRMQPRDETAARLEFERARRLVESHGWTVTAPETVGCEGVATAAIPDDEERRLQIAHYRTEFQQIAEWASNCARSSSADPADWRADMVAMSERLTRRLSV